MGFSESIAILLGLPSLVALLYSKRRLVRMTAAVVLVVLAFVVSTSLLQRFASDASDLPLDGYEWSELSDISAEIAEAGSYEEAIEIARRRGILGEHDRLDGTQEKTVTLSNGVETSVHIIGFNHDIRGDGVKKAGITFAFADSVAAYSMNESPSNDGGWKYSEMRSWLNEDFISLLPTDLLDVIVPVIKQTNNAGQAHDAGCVTPTLDALWLLSVTECLGDVWTGGENAYLGGIAGAEGDQYEVYANLDIHASSPEGNSILERRCLVEYPPEGLIHGESGRWWLRSPSAYTSSDFASENFGGAGEPDGNRNADEAWGVAPCFCI